MKFFVLTIFLLAFVSSGQGQIPITTHVQILKAEDARAYDAVLEGLLKSPNQDVRVRAALAAGRIGDDAAIPALAALLNDESNQVREMAAFALGEIESIKGADVILKALEKLRNERNTALMMEEVANGTNETASNRANATRAVTNLADVIARLIEACGKIAAANPKDEMSKALGEEIIRVLSREQRAMPKPSTKIIRLGLTAILRARPARAEDRAQSFLTDTDPNIVADALNTLSRLRVKNANVEVRALLEKHADPVVRANAARVLGAAEDKDAVELLIKAATKDPDSRVRVSAIRSLGALKDERGATALETYADSIVERISAREKRGRTNVAPPEVSEFLEITTALGNIQAGKKLALRVSSNPRLYEDAPANLMGPIMSAPETSIARVKTDPDLLMLGLLDRAKNSPAPMFKNWRGFSSTAEGLAVLAGLKKEIYGDGLEKHQREAREVLRLWLNQSSLPPNAIPDVLTAYAAFKPDDLPETLAEYLKHPDVFVRSTVAGLIADQPKTRGTSSMLEAAFEKALSTDKHDNDAQLALLDAMAKVDAAGSVDTIYKALNSPDYLVRKKAFALLEDPKLLAAYPGAANVARDARARGKDKVAPYSAASGTKLGQVLNRDADYRRALSRKNGSVRAVFTTEKGAFTIEFLPEDAPLTVDNFVKLARSGYFNGLEVHRVVPNFVMQDGDPLGNGSGGPGWSSRCEVNMVGYERGAVGMALSGKDTGGSQWFVTHAPQPHLDGGYTVFGRVNETGMKVVDRIVRGDKILRVRIVGR